MQHLLHKLPGRQLSHLQVEVQHLHTVYTSGFEQLQLGVGRRKELRYIGCMHHLARMLVEGYDHRLHPPVLGGLLKAVYNKLVSAVYAVEEADGGAEGVVGYIVVHISLFRHQS